MDSDRTLASDLLACALLFFPPFLCAALTGGIALISAIFPALIVRYNFRATLQELADRDERAIEAGERRIDRRLAELQKRNRLDDKDYRGQ